MRKTAAALLLSIPALAGAYDNVTLSRTVALEKQVKEPVAVLVTRSGKVVVSDAAQARLAVYTAQGGPEGFWGGKGKEPGALGEPRGLAEDSDGNVYVADRANHKVQVFSPEGKFLLAIGQKGAGPGQFSGPAAVAVTADGFLLVADAGNARVQVLSKEGIYFHSFAPAGEKEAFKDLSDIAVTRAGLVVLRDAGARAVRKFSVAGRAQGAVSGPGATKKEQDALPEPVALAVDDYGYLYVADGEQNKVKEFSPSGEFVDTFGTWGTGRGQFKKVTGLAVTPEGHIAVLDGATRRVQVFQLDSAAKTRRQAVSPALRLRVSPAPGAAPGLPALDDLAFLGGTLAGVSAKTSQLFLAPDYGKGAVKTLGGKGKQANQFNAPSGVAASGGVLLVADAGNRRLLMLDEKGEADAAGQIGGAGKREGQFKSPVAAAVDAQGRIHVVDAALARCQTFSRDGIYLNAVGSEGTGSGQLARPVDIAAQGEQLAVVDAERKTLLFFDTKGRFLSETGGFSNPVSVAADPAGKRPFFYVLDAGAAQVKVFGAKGQLVGSFGSPSLFSSPKALALDDKGRLWVSDSGGVKAFQVTLLPAAPAELKAQAGEGQITLRWAEDAEKLSAAYSIHRATTAQAEPSPYKVIAASETPFVDLEIVPGLTYYYSVAGRASLDKSAAEGPRASVKAATVRPANLPSIDITSLKLENIFSAQYKYYASHPIGRVTVKNNTEKLFQKVRVGFIIQDFMDYPSETLVDRLNSGAPAELDLKGVFNSKILSVSEDTPLQAQITVTYYEDGNEKVFKRTEAFKLYSRNAMSWTDPRRIATFVTPKDPPVLEFSRAVVKAFAEELSASPVNPAVLTGAVLFDALGAHGITYQRDPNNPYEKAVQSDAVDYVQYPRETLKRRSGDCDDLVSLYASALESVTVPTAMLDVPGHVLLLLRTDPTVAGPLGLPAELTVAHDDEVWVPVEVTWLGRPFDQAWREGARVYQEAGDKARVFPVHEAWDVYQPGNLPEGQPEAAPSKETVLQKFPDDLSDVALRRLETLAAPSRKALVENPKDLAALRLLGVLYAEHGRYDESAAWLDKALAESPADAAALNDRGNIHFVKGEFAKARELYEKAAQADARDGGVLLNLSRAAYQAGDKSAAEKSFQQALALKPELKKDLRSLDDLVK
jgi:DNA-binding beta-propeller fold protein YncE